ncbi:MAG: hypothetical protein M1835_002459 [Candelina submexicana]|nr:MAG: hypothetical protein M1835_002459 [Candelina submexicana]
MQLPAAKDVNFDIDKYLNRFVPRPRLHLLPKPVSWFLGYRDKPRREIGNVLVWGWSFVGAFCGVALIEGVVKSSPSIQSYAPPIILGSFGAAAILEYNTIESPLAQPRNSILGHFLSALVGVIITKLFQLSPQFENLRWLAGALSCGLASAVMGLTRTTHPPAGATALLAAVDPQVSALGWFLLPLVLLSSVLMLGSALAINNIQRQFPTFWWTPSSLSKTRNSNSTTTTTTTTTHDIEKVASGAKSSTSVAERNQEAGVVSDQEPRIVISAQKIVVPEGLYLAGEERGILEILQDRLRRTLESENGLASGSSSVTKIGATRD